MGERDALIVLRCLVYPGLNLEEEGYFAHCIDLDLMVFRPAIEDAMSELEESMRGYFEGIHSIDEFRAMVPRPAPFFPYRFQYHKTALSRAIPAAWRKLSASASFYDRPISTNELSAMGVVAC